MSSTVYERAKSEVTCPECGTTKFVPNKTAGAPHVHRWIDSGFNLHHSVCADPSCALLRSESARDLAERETEV